MTDYDFRMLIFLLCFVSFFTWQSIKPKVKLNQIGRRWRHNLSLFFIDILVVRLAQPLLLTSVALVTHNTPFLRLDIFNHFPIISLLLAILILDLAIYWQHRASHAVPLLWRIHQVHHSDPQIDLTTAVRFHPLEILFSLAYKAVIIFVFSIPFEAVLIFDMLLNSSALFNHANAHLPKKWDNFIRLFLVTPDMHRVHHSQNPNEANSNYSFFLSLWDRIFNSYTGQAKNTDLYLETGHPQYAKTFEKNPEKLSILNLIKMPFSLKNNKIEIQETKL
mgnify:FL=1